MSGTGVSAGTWSSAFRATSAIATTAIANRMMSMVLNTSHPDAFSLAENPATFTLTPYHGRNSEMRRTMPPTPALMSPGVNLEVSMGATLSAPPVG